MARSPSKIMSVAEKKTAEAGLKLAIKNTDAAIKASETDVAIANKALMTAKKQADALVAQANKAHEAALKEGGKLITAAQKLVDAATKKHTKVFDAANKGKEKLNGQLISLSAAPVEQVRRGRPPKTTASAGTPQTA